MITLDTHADIELRDFTAARNYTQRLDTQVDLPKMAEGGLDAVFFIVYVGQTFEEREADAFKAEGYERAYQAANAKFEAIHRLTKEMAPGRIELALTAADVRRIAAAGRKVALIGVENGYPLGDNLARVKEFYDRGARYLSLAHNGHNQLSDSNTGERDGLQMERPVAARPQGRRRAQPAGHHGGRLPPLEGVDDAGDRHLQGTDHRLALVGARARRSSP